MARDAQDMDGWCAEGFQRLAEWFGDQPPLLVVVLGSGLGGIAADRETRVLPYDEVVPWLSAFSEGGIPGHARQYAAVKTRYGPILLLQGRLHTYEGLTSRQAVAPLGYALGLKPKAVMITNAAGCLHEDWCPGDLMLIRDHLNLLGDSPLRGGPWKGSPSDRKFLDLSQAYDPFLMGLARDWAVVHTDLAGALREGVYAAVSGPNFETPAEIRMLRLLGADAVGMSTVAEVILSRMFECPVLGLSTMTNWGAGMKPGTVLDHDDVLAVTRRAVVAIGGLIDWLLPFLAGER